MRHCDGYAALRWVGLHPEAEAELRTCVRVANECDQMLQSDWPQLIQAYRGGSDSTGGGASVADPSAQQPRSEAPSTPPMEPAAKRQTTESPISTATLEKDVQEKSAI